MRHSRCERHTPQVCFPRDPSNDDPRKDKQSFSMSGREKRKRAEPPPPPGMDDPEEQWRRPPRTGKRLGGTSPTARKQQLAAANMAQPASLVLAVVILGSALFGGGSATRGTSFSYSVSSFSESRVQIDDGSGQPRFETRRQSSFSTNIPGLAERLAERGQEPLRDDGPWFLFD